MTSFARQPCPIWLFTDLTGNILDDNYYAHFLENTIPYLPQPAYQDAQGSDGAGPWANPLQFNPNGTLPNNLYFETGLTYRIEIRQGPTQSDPLVYLIENWVAGGSSVTPTSLSLPIDNQFTNPQFTEIFFNSPHTITNASGTNDYPIAPGWVVEISSNSSATVTVTRTALAGNQNLPLDTPTNPAYVLQVAVASGTLTSLKLKQRFNNTPAIWAQQGVSVTFTGKVESGAGDISVIYLPSDGASSVGHIIANETLSSVYQVVAGGIQLPESDSTDTGANGFVDIVFDLPIIGSTYLTNLQVIGSPQAATFPYAQTTPERQKDQMFNVYADALIQQPKSNLLVGWTFALNPWQFRSTTSSNVADNTYTADQTIIVQQKYVLDGTGNNVAVGRGTAAENYAFEVKAVTATNRIAMIQYIDPATIRPYWGEKLSALIKASISSPTHSSTCRFKVKLIYRSSLPPTLAQDEPIATWLAAADSEPVLKAGWTAIDALNDPTYVLGTDTGPFVFDQFELPASDNANMTLGVMVYTLDEIDQSATADRILFDRVSLVHNDFAIDAAPETWDEALRKCQYYYQKTYDSDVLPDTVSLPSAITYRAANSGASPNGVQWQFKVAMRDTATIAAYNPSVISSTTWRNITLGADSGASSFLNNGKNGVFISNAQDSGDSTNDQLIIHASADARLGK